MTYIYESKEKLLAAHESIMKLFIQIGNPL